MKIFNDRGAVICAADISPLVAPGVVKSYEASAEFQLVEVAGETVEIGGCLNMLTPDRPQTRGTSSMSPNSCLVQVEKWRNAEAFKTAPRSVRRQAMSKWNLIINVGRCENCYNCVIAERDEHVGNDFPGYAAPAAAVGDSPIRILRRVQGSAPMVETTYLPVMCNHCDDAPCIRHAGDAIRKRDDGIVIIDPVKAQGRKDIVGSCPYRRDRLERGAAGAADLDLRRPPARSGLAAAPLPAGLPDRRLRGGEAR